MFTRKKIGIISLVVALFVIGVLAFNSFQAVAIEDTNSDQTDGHGYGFGFWKDKFGNIAKDSEEWQAKIEKFEAHTTARDSGKKGHHRGFTRLHSEDVDYIVENLDNGVQITITSDDPEIVQKLQDAAARKLNHSTE